MTHMELFTLTRTSFLHSRQVVSTEAVLFFTWTAPLSYGVEQSHLERQHRDKSYSRVSVERTTPIALTIVCVTAHLDSLPLESALLSGQQPVSYSLLKWKRWLWVSPVSSVTHCCRATNLAKKLVSPLTLRFLICKAGGSNTVDLSSLLAESRPIVQIIVSSKNTVCNHLYPINWWWCGFSCTLGMRKLSLVPSVMCVKQSCPWCLVSAGLSRGY